jgi:signal transduction histidine kinase
MASRGSDGAAAVPSPPSSGLAHERQDGHVGEAQRRAEDLAAGVVQHSARCYGRIGMSGHLHAGADLADELQASRTRIVEAADEARRRIERDLHDGAQQRLVTASLLLNMAMRNAGDGGRLREDLERVASELEAGLAELRELARGIHPAILTTKGLNAAVEALAARSNVPVRVTGALPARPAAAVELALYFTVAEALTNVAKYAAANEVVVAIEGDELQAEVEVRDDGRGGADPANGSGLRGLVDRLGALRGHLHVESPAGVGTTLRAVVPLDPHDPGAATKCGCCAVGQCRCAA